MLRKLLDKIFPTTVIAETEGWVILGWKYTPHALVLLAAVLILYYVNGWELP